jgi:hypothetical protein
MSLVTHLGGNVAEWTSEWYGPYAAGPQASPKGPASGVERVVRGGSFETEEPALLRSSARAAWSPEVALPDVGVRCAADRVFGRFPYTQVTEAFLDEKGPESPYQGTWAFADEDGTERTLEIDRLGRIHRPALHEGRVSPDGRLRMIQSTFTLVDARCTGDTCTGTAHSPIEGVRAPFTMHRR